MLEDMEQLVLHPYRLNSLGFHSDKKSRDELIQWCLSELKNSQ